MLVFFKQPFCLAEFPLTTDAHWTRPYHSVKTVTMAATEQAQKTREDQTNVVHTQVNELIKV